MLYFYMNIALVYRGFYKRDKGKTNNFNLEIFKNHLDSINSLGIKNIDIYIHTYSVNDYEDKKLLSLFLNYNLIKYVFEKEIKEKISYSIINSLELVDKNYDLIINTRFDVYFIKYLSNWSINCNKFNLAFKDRKVLWIKHKKVSDLIYIFPPKYNNILISALKKSQDYRSHGPGHFIYKHLNINENEINFMIDGFFLSNTDILLNNYIYIKRH
jgi:hypothetical protein